jgi:hypothetical protein
MNILSKEQALALGVNHFYTGVECKNGHLSRRRVSNGACLSCDKMTNEKRKAKRAEWYANNRVDALSKISAWYKNDYIHNKDKYASRSKAWRDKNMDRAKEICKRWHEANREYHNNQIKKWQQNNPDKQQLYYERPYTAAARRRWNQNNKGLKNFYTRCRHTHIKRATPQWTNMQLVKQVYIECAAITAHTGISHHVDHIIPLISNIVCGLHVYNNLQILTATENMSKNNTFMIE